MANNGKYLKETKVKFSKKIVIFCISFIVLYTALELYLSYKLNIELSPTLTTCVYTFFGTELASTAVIKIFENLIISTKSNKSDKPTTPPDGGVG